ncbi:MAG: hypothetical protein LBE84_11475 [Planctomycetota bacterium]|jgi:hypothetical protein|nr:hypothetical protein [Planctomycetota bacterium]
MRTGTAHRCFFSDLDLQERIAGTIGKCRQEGEGLDESAREILPEKRKKLCRELGGALHSGPVTSSSFAAAPSSSKNFRIFLPNPEFQRIFVTHPRGRA